jgi:hypothetical protein
MKKKQEGKKKKKARKVGSKAKPVLSLAQCI